MPQFVTVLTSNRFSPVSHVGRYGADTDPVSIGPLSYQREEARSGLAPISVSDHRYALRYRVPRDGLTDPTAIRLPGPSRASNGTNVVAASNDTGLRLPSRVGYFSPTDSA